MLSVAGGGYLPLALVFWSVLRGFSPPGGKIVLPEAHFPPLGKTGNLELLSLPGFT
jgi:hypothetical protein